MLEKFSNITNLESFKFSKEHLGEIRKKAILECYNWWGLKYPGFSGIILTEDNEMYSYSYYERIPEELKDKNINYIVKNKELNTKDYKKVKKFIENEILTHQFDNVVMRDAGYDVILNYNGVKMTIANNKGLDNQLLIYDKTQKFMQNILNKKENFIIKILNNLKNLFQNNKIKQITSNSNQSSNTGEILEDEFIPNTKANDLQQLINDNYGDDPFWRDAINSFFEKVNRSEIEKVNFLSNLVKNSTLFNEFTKEITSLSNADDIFEKYQNITMIE